MSSPPFIQSEDFLRENYALGSDYHDPTMVEWCQRLLMFWLDGSGTSIKYGWVDEQMDPSRQAFGIVGVLGPMESSGKASQIILSEPRSLLMTSTDEILVTYKRNYHLGTSKVSAIRCYATAPFPRDECDIGSISFSHVCLTNNTKPLNTVTWVPFEDTNTKEFLFVANIHPLEIVRTEKTNKLTTGGAYIGTVETIVRSVAANSKRVAHDPRLTPLHKMFGEKMISTTPALRIGNTILTIAHTQSSQSTGQVKLAAISMCAAAPYHIHSAINFEVQKASSLQFGRRLQSWLKPSLLKVPALPAGIAIKSSNQERLLMSFEHVESGGFVAKVELKVLYENLKSIDFCEAHSGGTSGGSTGRKSRTTRSNIGRRLMVNPIELMQSSNSKNITSTDNVIMIAIAAVFIVVILIVRRARMIHLRKSDVQS